MSRQVIDYIRQSDMLDTQSVEHLRSMVDKYPYYHAARILLLRALYKMHDSAFNEQLHKAAIYVPSRQTLFQMFESDNHAPESPAVRQSRAAEIDEEDRTQALIDNFIGNMPSPSPSPKHTVDATQDYMAYLMQMEKETAPTQTQAPPMHGQDIIDDFLTNNEGRFEITDLPESGTPHIDESFQNDVGTGVLTEAMARIYIKQGKYDKAIEIIQRISLKYPKKNRYFADQIRFLRKLIINEQAKESLM